MRILKVIHGYPPSYNAGSEVYSQTLCGELCKKHEVHVFTREENPFAADGSLRQSADHLNDGIALHIVNAARAGVNYFNAAVDRAFVGVLDKVAPDIVHVGHLNHLSLGIVPAAAAREIPVVFTLHDFWLMCLRGQFIQYAAEEGEDTWRLCSGQDDAKCADRCLRRFYSGADEKSDAAYWTQWTARRMDAVRRTAELTDVFIAPARHLAERFQKQFALPESKTVYLDYGFDRQRLQGRKRVAGEPFTFGYIGTHIPGKGVHHLLRAFAAASSRTPCRLRIWGRETANTAYLKAVTETLPDTARESIEWMGEYANSDVVADVFNRADAIVVPSIWEENSPLVIHEAQQARVPVVAADMGGMAEYVRHEKNGLLFAPRDCDSMAEQMARLAENPAWAKQLGLRGYWLDENGEVPDVTEHARAVENIYHNALRNRDNARVKMLDAPWRVTFDTNPDHCNYRCTMCEEHSPHSNLQTIRIANKVPKRIMPFEIIERNVRSLAPMGLREIIPSTMGEPLLYKDFEKIIALCQDTGVMLNLTTNGSFPRLGARDWARLLVPVTSDIKVSWNGACKKTQEAVMENCDWDDMLGNVRVLISERDAHAEAGGNRCRITFQMTFMEVNFSELPEIVRLAASLGVDRVKGHHLWAHFPEIKNQDMRRDADSIRRWNAIVAETRKAAKETLLSGGDEVLLENIEEISDSENGAAPAGKCPFLGREAWVNAEGRFDPCCAPDAERKTLGHFGFLRDAELIDIWRGDSYRLLARTYRSRAVCQKCNMRKK